MSNGKMYRGRYDEKSLTGSYSTTRFGIVLSFLICNRSDLLSYGRKRIVFVDNDTACSYVPSSATVLDAGKINQRIDVASQNKLWKHVGGHDLSTMEILIYLGAGYGVFRWFEYFITTVFVK